MSDLEQRISGLSAAKQELLLRKLKEREAARQQDRPAQPERQAIPQSPKRERGEPLPLSAAQERLWFLDQLEPGTTAFNMSQLLPLDGPFDSSALRLALAELFRRHEVLRTHFTLHEERPVQNIVERLILPLPTVDLSALREDERDTVAIRLRGANKAWRFDLAADPMLAVILVRLSVDEHRLLVFMHHIASDGWSLGLLAREVKALYEAQREGRSAQLPDLPIQYADYADWQRTWLESDEAKSPLDFWRRQLAGLPPLELITDRPRPKHQTFHGASCRLDLPMDLVERLRQLAEEKRASLFMVLLTAFEIMLWRFSGQRDFAIGTFIAGRTRHEIENLIGFFVNNLVLRASLGGDPTLGKLVERMRRVTLDAYAHQEVPFEKLLEILQPERDLSRAALFQVMCVLHNLPTKSARRASRPNPTLPPVTISERANFDLTLWLAESEDGVDGRLQYNTDLFDRSTVERFTAYLRRLIEALAENDPIPLSRFDSLNEAEREQILNHSIGPASPGEVALVPNRFLDAVAQHRDAPAFLGAEGATSYRVLATRSAALATRLVDLGCGPEVPIAIYLESTLDRLLALLAVMRAGGVQMPFDPTHFGGAGSAHERLRGMLEDGLFGGGRETGVVLTREHLKASLPNLDGLRVLTLDELTLDESDGQDNQGRTATSLARIDRPLHPQQAAYVIYTSGSTGRPKGVVISHGALASFVDETTRTYAITPKDRVLQFASTAFDASVEEIYPALISGAALVERPRDAGSGQAFAEHCEAFEISVLDLPTAFWHFLSQNLEAGNMTWPRTPRLVILGGEAARGDRLQAWRQAAGQKVRLVNTYGPTEATVVATRWWQEPDAPRASTPHDPPIGRPTAGRRALVLDRHQRLLPADVPGELHLGETPDHPSLARGYLHRPSATAERFVPDPFAEANPSGARLYRSGDRARWREGELEFLGRVDQQVKVRGYRIELGDIESVLAAHPELADAVVVAHRRELEGLSTADSAPDLTLVAYMVARGSVETANLRAYLDARLPGFMVPAHLIWVDDLPQTPGGKVDRGLLTRRRLPETQVETAYEAPRDETEEILAEIFATVLRRERVGVHDNFFDLGGHSLLATQIATRVRGTFELELPLMRLFEAPTVAGLAVVIEDLLIAELEGLSDEEAEALAVDEFTFS